MRPVLVPLSLSPELPPIGSTVRELAGSSMGTTWSARMVLPAGQDEQAIRPHLQRQLDIVVAQMSHWDSSSELSQYNNAPAGTWRHLPSAFYKVLDYALGVSLISGNAYDPCAGALVNLWGFGAARRYDQPDFYAPADSDIKAIVDRMDANRIELDDAGRKLLQPGGVQLDFSSVAKGYAVDQLALSLETQGIRHYVVEVGGELRGAGVKPNGEPWWVALEGVPGDENEQPLVALHGPSVATSGDYRRYFDYRGQRVSHTLDPRTGYPIRNNVASVSVIHAECMVADAVSTALSVLGVEDGMLLAEEMGIAARFLVRSSTGKLEEARSSIFESMLE